MIYEGSQRVFSNNTIITINVSVVIIVNNICTINRHLFAILRLWMLRGPKIISVPVTRRKYHSSAATTAALPTSISYA